MAATNKLPKKTAAHSSFEWLRSHTIESLNLTASEYRHKETGATHIHLDADNHENVFLVALRTVPEDSKGVAHILEHTALCGSKKYPVRDPFFMMIKRSLNTFMNAFTSSDWTAYPFASQNRRDFDNLLSVYLDAVFFATLDPLDFAQEGHRLDFEEPGNTDSPLVYKGVVYNEMKGAMSSVTSQLWHRLCHHVFPESTYHYNSGGEPSDIVKLSYDELQHFYKTHYHPSNAIFMTFGNIAAAEHQATFEEQALKQFKALDKVISVAPEKRLSQAIRVNEPYACNDQDLSSKTHIVVAWLLGPSIDLQQNLEAYLLASLLYDNSASPLQNALETTELGNSPSPLCGLDDSQYEMLFVAGVEGSESSNTEAVEALIESVLSDIAAKGIDQESIDASLHQLELHQRELSGDGYPYGLQLILNSLSQATHRGDAIAVLDIDQALNSLREAVKDPNFVQNAIKRLLLNNSHRVTLTLSPDNTLESQNETAQLNALAAIKDKLSKEELVNIATQAKALEARQLEEPNSECLPKVGLADIPAKTHHAIIDTHAINHSTLSTSAAGTNGLAYQQVILPSNQLPEALIDYLPYYTLCLTEVGIGKDDYLATQKRQAKTVGSLSAFYSLKANVDDTQQLSSYITVSTKALTRNYHDMTSLLSETITQPRFDELDRINELVAQAYAAKQQSITGSGHVLAMNAACANFSSSAYIANKLSGLKGLQTLKKLASEKNADLASQLSTLQQSLSTMAQQWLLVSEPHTISQYQQPIIDHLTSVGDVIAPTHTTIDVPQKSTNQAWITDSQVHFCAKAFPSVPVTHPDAAALTVLGGVLRNGFLHRAIREQGGAYGGGASQDNSSGCFRFYSYRDPRMAETLDDFDSSVKWLTDSIISQEQVTESILGVVSSLDKPGSPAGIAKKAFHNQLSGRTNIILDSFRQAVINVNAEDIKRVAETYLTPEKAHTAIVTGEHGLAQAKSLEFAIHTL